MVRDACRNENDIAGADINRLTMFSAKAKFCSAIIDTEHFVRCAVIMSK